MKIKLLTVAMVFSAFAFTSCQISDQNNNSSDISASDIDSENPAIMTFEEDNYDFGTVAIGETVAYTYKFTNTGKAPLIIHSVKPSCGCTALKGWPKQPIQPGESGEIPIEYTPSVPGNTTKTISIVATTSPSLITVKLHGKVAGN